MEIPRWIYYLLTALALAGAGAAQTKVDLRTQAKTVDFSQADSTRPSKTGTGLPASCAVGETFLRLDAPAGRNWYTCLTANQWTLEGADAPAPGAGNQNSVLASDGSAAVWKALGGDVSGAPDALTVNRILGRPLDATAPSPGQVLTWGGSSWGAASLPPAALSSVFGRAGAVTAQTGDYQFSQIGGTILSGQLPPPGGDLSGVFSSATVARLQNRPMAATAPSTGQVLTWSGVQWEPEAASGGVTSAFGRTGAIVSQTGDYSFGQISGTVGSSQLPSLGGDLSGLLTSATVSRLQSRPVAATAPTTGQALAWDGAQWLPQTIAAGVTTAFGRSGAITAQAGDYSASQVTNAVDKTQATNYTSGARQNFSGSATSAGLQIAPSGLPTAAQTGDMVVDSGDSNQLKVYNGTSWVGATPSTTPANYVTVFIGQTTISVPGTTHRLGTASLLVACYDNSVPASMIEPSTITVDPTTYNVTVVFPAAQSGRCVINGYSGVAGSGGGSGGAVSTVFGRSGDVVAGSGDYAFSQIGGTVANSQVAAGLDAAKIGAGLVTNQAYGYLANVSSDIQGQLNGKAASSHTHTAAGDVTGALSATVVTGIQGRAVSNTAPLDGQVLAWSATANQWRAANGGGGGSGGGAGMASQLGDFGITLGSSTVLQIGANCSATTPCNVRFGSRVYSLTSGAQATLNSGAGTAYVYVTANGVLTVGHTMGVTCSSSCVAAVGVTGFPVDSIPLYSWNAANGVWEATGMDRRSWIGRTTLLAGTGIVAVEAGGQTTIAIDSTAVPTYMKNSVSLDFARISAGSCSADLTFTLSGAAPGDTVAPGWPSGMESGLIGNMWVSAANQISVRLCAIGRDVDPASAVFSATIIRGL
jgi:hypothetical protein